MKDIPEIDLVALKEQNYLNMKEAAAYLRIPEATFRKKVAERIYNIPFTKIGKRIIFKRDLLDRWMEGLISSGKDL